REGRERGVGAALLDAVLPLARVHQARHDGAGAGVRELRHHSHRQRRGLPRALRRRVRGPRHAAHAAARAAAGARQQARARRRRLPELAAGLVALSFLPGLLSVAVPLWMLRRAEDRSGAERVTMPDLLRSMVAYCRPLLGARITFTSGQNLSTLVVGKLFDNT